MEILENKADWLAQFQTGWLAHFEQTGERKWDLYNRPKNSESPSGPRIDLSSSRLILITSAGSYLKDGHKPYDAANPLGDYSIRVFPTATPFEELSFAHDQYNHTAVTEDPQVLIPLRHLEDMVAEGLIGELASSVISFHGYVPDQARFVDETIPQILRIAKEEQAQAALLIPA